MTKIKEAYEVPGLQETVDIKDEMQQLIGPPPQGIIRWGISAVMVVLMLILGVSYLIQYPDTVMTNVALVSEQPPIRIPSPRAGKISALLVNHNQKVEEGQMLAVLENTARWEDVLWLEEWTEKQLEGRILPADLGRQMLSLGVLQMIYSEFSRSFSEYQMYAATDESSRRIRANELEIDQLREQNISLKASEKLLEKEVEITADKFERDKGLFKSGAISRNELNESEILLLGYQRRLKEASAARVANNNRMYQLESGSLQLRQGANQTNNARLIMTWESLGRLHSAIESWKRENIIFAPVDGILTFTSLRVSQQFVQPAEELFSIAPNTESLAVIGQTLIASAQSAKVSIGMESQIRVNSHPYQEFGHLKAKVSRITQVPANGGYLVLFELPEGMTSSYGHELPFLQEMEGQVRIILEEKRLLERIVDRFLQAIN